MANLIDQLPKVNEDKPENKTAVDAVLKQYEALTEDHPADKTVTSAVVPN